jgi:hypothetical protein
MKRNLIRLALATLVLVLVLGAPAPAQINVRQVVCPPDPIPAGWLKVDVISSPATCGGDAWVIEPFTNKAAGSAMVVCADQPTPAGWRTLGIATSTGQCAGGTVPDSNIKAILRVG